MKEAKLSTKRTYTAISDTLKNAICQYHFKNPNKTQIQIVEHFNIQDPNRSLDYSTISKILKEKTNGWPLMKIKLLQAHFAIIKEKAAYFAKALALCKDGLKFSNGWLHGEASSTPIQILPESQRNLQNIIQEYTLSDVFNADETNPSDEESKNSDSEDIEKLSPIRTNNHENRCGHGH
ncbi:15969_t:CDS:2 [Dentiscutata heterogama]|uniref:15969_t:CDS:1 n=1 Tax=Dentiscutata heterogama TaxID=1316150 RepID=A0ACA9K0S6_9GLOM|nr:15969_t:CDS:2 [Dentiscutata heterogama]